MKNIGDINRRLVVFSSIFLILGMAIFLSACDVLKQNGKDDIQEEQQANMQEDAQSVSVETYSEDIAKLFPDDLVVWTYEGFAEYMHKMEILSII